MKHVASLDAVIRADCVHISLLFPGEVDPLFSITILPKRKRGRVERKDLLHLIELTDFLTAQCTGEKSPGLLIKPNFFAQSLGFWMLRLQRALFPHRVKWEDEDQLAFQRRHVLPAGFDYRGSSELPLDEVRQCPDGNSNFRDILPNPRASDILVGFGCEISSRLPADAKLIFALPSSNKWRGIARGEIARLRAFLGGKRSSEEEEEEPLLVFCNPAVNWVSCALRSLDIRKLSKHECRAAVNAVIGADEKTNTVYANVDATNDAIETACKAYNKRHRTRVTPRLLSIRKPGESNTW